ncbi:hypothetical protein CR513_23092, partial [Mucuna pruriens]
MGVSKGCSWAVLGRESLRSEVRGKTASEEWSSKIGIPGKNKEFNHVSLAHQSIMVARTYILVPTGFSIKLIGTPNMIFHLTKCFNRKLVASVNLTIGLYWSSGRSLVSHSFSVLSHLPRDVLRK